MAYSKSLALFLILVAHALFVSAQITQGCRPVPATGSIAYTSLSANRSEVRGSFAFMLEGYTSVNAIAGTGIACTNPDLCRIGLTPTIPAATAMVVCTWLYNFSAVDTVPVAFLYGDEFVVNMLPQNGEGGIEDDYVIFSLVSIVSDDDDTTVTDHYFTTVLSDGSVTLDPVLLPAGPVWNHVCIGIPGTDYLTRWNLYINGTLSGAIDPLLSPGLLPASGFTSMFWQIPPNIVVGKIDDIIIMQPPMLATIGINHAYTVVASCYDNQRNPDNLTLLDRCMADSFPLLDVYKTCDFQGDYLCSWWTPLGPSDAYVELIDEYETSVIYGFVDQALILTNEGSYVRFPALENALDTANGYSLSIWVYNITNLEGGLFFVNSTTLADSSVGTFSAQARTDSTTRFVHLAVTVDETVTRTYVDGLLVNQTDTLSAWWPAVSLQSIGGSNATGRFAERIDEFVFHKRPLTQTEVEAMAGLTDCVQYLRAMEVIQYRKTNFFFPFDANDIVPLFNGYESRQLRAIPCSEGTYRVGDALTCEACDEGFFGTIDSGCIINCTSLPQTRLTFNDGSGTPEVGRIMCQFTLSSSPSCVNTGVYETVNDPLCINGVNCTLSWTPYVHNPLPTVFFSYIGIWFNNSVMADGLGEIPIVYWYANARSLVFVSDSILHIGDQLGSYTPIVSLAEYVNNDWHHLLISTSTQDGDGTRVNLYIDGTYVFQVHSPALYNANGLISGFSTRFTQHVGSVISGVLNGSAGFVAFNDILYSEEPCLNYTPTQATTTTTTNHATTTDGTTTTSIIYGSVLMTQKDCKHTFVYIPNPNALDDEEPTMFSVLYAIWPVDAVGVVDTGAHVATFGSVAIITTQSSTKSIKLELTEVAVVSMLWQPLQLTNLSNPVLCVGSGEERNVSTMTLQQMTECSVTRTITVISRCNKEHTSTTVSIVFGVFLLASVIALVAYFNPWTSNPTVKYTRLNPNRSK